MFSFFSKSGERSEGERVYFDYAAATPLALEVKEAMEPYWQKDFANASAIHKEGQAARKAVEDARGDMAKVLRCRAPEITFTSGGTESNNLAIFGVVEAKVQSGTPYSEIEVISTLIEHPSVLEALKVLENRGVVVRYVPVDEGGRIVDSEFRQLLNEKTLLIVFSYVNSEVGVIENVKHLTHIVRRYKTEHTEQELFVHLDASQAPLWLPCQSDSLGVDLMTLDGGKMYGPKGVGILMHKGYVPITHQTFGGDQESGLRAGTENTALIVGMARAMARANARALERSEEVSKLRDVLIEKLEKEIVGVHLNGSREHRVANNVNISIKGVDGEYAVVWLDNNGVAASTKSACSGAKGGGSHVVRTLTEDEGRSMETIRLTLGEETTEKDLEKVIAVLKEHEKLVRNSK